MHWHSHFGGLVYTQSRESEVNLVTARYVQVLYLPVPAGTSTPSHFLGLTMVASDNTELSISSWRRCLFCGRYIFHDLHLLYAESKNCALLKEAAIDNILKNKAEVIQEAVVC